MEEVLTIYTNSKKQINVEVVTVLFAFLIVRNYNSILIVRNYNSTTDEIYSIVRGN